MKAIRKVIFKNNRQTDSLGRNGWINTHGIDIQYDSREMITLSPIRKNTDIGRCQIQIPVEDVNALIVTLQELVK
jgi:hypothetical protein